MTVDSPSPATPPTQTGYGQGQITQGCGTPELAIDDDKIREMISASLDAWGGSPRRALVLAPDITRLASGAGRLACILHEQLAPECEVHILPTLGTHAPMTRSEIERMYPGIPHESFIAHDWRNDVVSLGHVPAEFIRTISGGALEFDAEVALNRAIVEGDYDLIISVGQVVPHEVAGMANHLKNILIGAGGPDLLNKSHYLGAVWGIERIMGQAVTPVRLLLERAAALYLRDLPIKFVLNVLAADETGATVTRGLFIGEGRAPFTDAAGLSARVNIERLARPIRKAVVWLDPDAYKSTWLANKAIYRLRMAMADGGELLVLAPGVCKFGEDPEIDRLIRSFGYRGTPATLEALKTSPELESNLAAAAHLIHGSSEGRFKITYAPGGLTREEVESVGYAFGDIELLRQKYDPAALSPGANSVNGEEIYFVPDPGQGLWVLDPDG